MPEWPKGAACKAVIRGFKSRSALPEEIGAKLATAGDIPEKQLAMKVWDPHAHRQLFAVRPAKRSSSRWAARIALSSWFTERAVASGV